jgi:hypothetical protein
MAAAITMVVPTIVISIASGTTMMTTDIIAAEATDGEATAETLANMMHTATSARRTTHAKTVSANRIVATEIHLEIEAAEVGGLFHSAAQLCCHEL